MYKEERYEFWKKSVADKRDKLTSANARTGRSAGVYALRTGFFLLLLLVVTIISLGVGILRGLIDSAPDISDVNIMPLETPLLSTTRTAMSFRS